MVKLDIGYLQLELFNDSNFCRNTFNIIHHWNVGESSLKAIQKLIITVQKLRKSLRFYTFIIGQLRYAKQLVKDVSELI